METTDYCSYELSKALKACGFDEPCDHYYCAFDNETDVRFWGIHPAQSQNGFTNPDGKVIADAPTLAHAQKWLREERDVDIELIVYLVDAKREYRPYILLPTNLIACNTYKQYEQALQEGIKAALELIKPEKQH